MEKMPAIDHLRGLLEAQLRGLERSEPGVRSGADPEQLHRFRVAARRSRALIRASRPLIRDQLSTLDRELKWLGGAAGPTRDLDVLIDHLRGLLAVLDPDQAGAELIIAGLERERLQQREALLKAIESERYEDLLARFASSLSELTATDGETSLARLAAKELRRLRAAYEDLGPRPADVDLHAVRIKAKHARYAAELAALEGGARLETLVEAVTDLQDLIGSHQDAVVAEQKVRTLASGDSLLAGGRIIELERRRKRKARKKLPKTWRRIEKAAARAF